MESSQKTRVSGTEVRIKGVALSEGIAIARICMFNEHRHSNLPMYKVTGDGVERELNRLERALDIAKERIGQLQESVVENIGAAEGEIFTAHKMILDDPSLHQKIVQQIETTGINAETAVSQVLDSFEARMRSLGDEYMRERASDFAEIRDRILDVLGNMHPALQCDDQHCLHGKNRMVVAEELTPSLTVDLDTSSVCGFVTERGGVNSHAAILARALGIPAVSGIRGIRDMVGCGIELLVNGYDGEIIIWPHEKTVHDILEAHPQHLRRHEIVEPIDGFCVMGNISISRETNQCLKMLPDGIGLYRTEFELMDAGRFLTENELYERLKSVAQAFDGKPVVYRLLDIGSDKTMPFMNIDKEENPALGLRGARLLLSRPELIEIQARALARVSRDYTVRVLYPMIADVAQFEAVDRIFSAAAQSLGQGRILKGIMFEVPSACLVADELFERIDFASIGTNDLLQYLFAVDRNNEHVAADYNPDHPIFWGVIQRMATLADKYNKPLSMCGEMAGNPRFISKLIECGIRSVSVSPMRIPDVRAAAQSSLQLLAKTNSFTGSVAG
ncbi:MAG: phosphoenolpyruvate--protein phosphotransferase [Spartobacteria bacterium]|nr:phosphoenolpyruvate--protein phosphotransferase [Spartobacteria bacterium]